MKKLFALLMIAATCILLFADCAKQWTCDWCGKTWFGDAYYGSDHSDTLCAECASQYWSPFPYRNYKK